MTAPPVRAWYGRIGAHPPAWAVDAVIAKADEGWDEGHVIIAVQFDGCDVEVHTDAAPEDLGDATLGRDFAWVPSLVARLVVECGGEWEVQR